VIFEDWGLIEYEASVRRQLELVDRVAAGDGPERIVLCTHPPVVTLGRATVAADLDGWTGALIETSRGGRATYHGPSQQVIYPVLDLRRERPGLRPRDVHAYLRAVEIATVDALADLGVRGEARETKIGEVSLTGVWAGERKIASLGIAVRKWVTYHGVAVNVTHDPAAFRGIRPCGFSADVMTSVEAETGRAVDPVHAAAAFRRHFARAFARSEPGPA
jgi:lipoate-protein ligase B